MNIFKKNQEGQFIVPDSDMMHLQYIMNLLQSTIDSYLIVAYAIEGLMKIGCSME